MLNLSWNGLGEKGGIALADALLANSTLTELNISANRLNYNVAVKFAKILAANEALEVLEVNLTGHWAQRYTVQPTESICSDI